MKELLRAPAVIVSRARVVLISLLLVCSEKSSLALRHSGGPERSQSPPKGILRAAALPALLQLPNATHRHQFFTIEKL